MKPFPPEPLSPEERELAQLTERLGPHGEPSVALDARVMAAAHAALQPRAGSRRKPRWPVALGLAASVVFAVGIAWQLQPLQPAPPVVVKEAPEALEQPRAFLETEATPATESADQAAMAVVAEPEAGAMQKSAPGQAEAAPALSKAVAPPQAPAARGQTARNTRPASVPEPSVLQETRSADHYRAATPMSAPAPAAAPPPPPPPPPAPAAAVASAPLPVEEAPLSFAADVRAEAAADRVSANDIGNGANARAAHARSASAAGAAAASVGYTATKASAAKNNAADARERESAELDRIEVSGSRLKRTDLQVPVSDDARLPVNEWLERVRTRYGLGDAGAAKKSLLLFVKDHPGEAVPGDLEPLLDE